jgi:hypothetical protein
MITAFYRDVKKNFFSLIFLDYCQIQDKMKGTFGFVPKPHLVSKQAPEKPVRSGFSTKF